MIPEIKKYEATNTDRAIKWLHENKNQPFLLIIPDKNGEIGMLGMGRKTDLLGSLDYCRDYFLHPHEKS